MSVDVELGRLHEEVERFGSRAFLLSVREDRPHVVSVTVARDGDDIVAAVGRRSAANAAATPGVSLLWPAPSHDPAAFSLIVDGTARADASSSGGDGALLRIRPSKAVLHRSRDAVEPGAAGSDCRPVL